MINVSILEGVIVKTWRFADDLLIRLASYRDPDMPAKMADNVRDAADYVTVRVTKGSLGAPVVVEKGQQIRVEGLLQSRDYRESLKDFLQDAKGPNLQLPEGFEPTELTASRGTTEVLARRIVLIENTLGTKAKK